ncbi:MAG: hypothetical protein ACO1SX_03750 [Actinomycetota bacterium]
MGWTLLCYRRVGDAALTLSELDCFFAQRREFERFPEEGAALVEEVRFEHGASAPQPAFAFVFTTDFAIEEAPRADFPFEETPLSVEVDFDLDDPSAAPDLSVMLAAVAAAASELRLLVSDPQLEQDPPGPPLPDRLAQSYTRRRTEIIETVQYFEARRKRMLAIAGGLLVAALAMAALLALGGGRS